MPRPTSITEPPPQFVTQAAAPIGVSLSFGDGQEYGSILYSSKLAYFDYFIGRRAGEIYRNEASQSLLGQRVASKSGTTTDIFGGHHHPDRRSGKEKNRRLRRGTNSTHCHHL